MKLPDNDTKIWIGYGLGFTVAIATVICAYVGGANWPLQMTLCFLGGALGWTVGIILSPLDDEEATKFGSMGKTAAAVLSGFAFAKLEEPIVEYITQAFDDDGHLFSFRIALFLTLFVIGFLFTLISRLYGDEPAKRRTQRQARLLAQADKLLTKYQQSKSEA